MKHLNEFKLNEDLQSYEYQLKNKKENILSLINKLETPINSLIVTLLKEQIDNLFEMIKNDSLFDKKEFNWKNENNDPYEQPIEKEYVFDKNALFAIDKTKPFSQNDLRYFFEQMIRKINRGEIQ